MKLLVKTHPISVNKGRSWTDPYEDAAGMLSSLRPNYNLAVDQPSQFAMPAFPPAIDRPIDGASSLGYIAQVVVLSKFRDLLAQRQAVVDNLDLEGVHKIRVAARRIRTALQTFAPVWEEGRAKHFSKRFAKFADKFGAARDLDVLKKYLAGDVEAEDVEPEAQYPALEARVSKLRDAQQKKVSKAVLRLDKAGFIEEVVGFFSTHPVDLWKVDGGG